MTSLRRQMFNRLVRFAAADGGAVAAEFVMAAPLAIALVLAAINAGMMMYAGSTLHFATEDAARCGAVRAVCASIADTQTYAAARYKGPTAAPAFTATRTGTCSQVSATASYNFTIGIASYNVPLSATACYPLQPTA